MRLKYKDWIILREKVPFYLKDLVSLCADFYRKADNEIIGKSIILPQPVFELYSILIKVLGFYKGFVKLQKMGDKDLIEDIEKKIDSIFDNILFITMGRGKQSIDLRSLSENTETKAQYLVSMADTFFDGVIYSGLSDTYAYLTKKEVFLFKFVEDTIIKLGLPRVMDTKGGGDLDLLMGDQDKKKKKDGKK